MDDMRLPLIAMVILFCGCVCDPPDRSKMEPLYLTVTEALDVQASLYAYSKYGSNLGAVNGDDYFALGEIGLPEGTLHGFRFIGSNGSVAIPLYREIIMKAGEKEGVEYYGVPDDDYIVELVKINGSAGTIVARMNLSVYDGPTFDMMSRDNLRRRCTGMKGEAFKDCAMSLVRAGNCSGLGGGMLESCVSRLEDILSHSTVKTACDNATQDGLKDCIEKATERCGEDTCLCLQNRDDAQVAGHLTERCGNLTGDVKPGERDLLYDCMENLAVEDKNIRICDKASTLNRTTPPQLLFHQCINNFAAKTKDTSVCEKTSMPKDRGFCKALALKDWTECQRITCDFSCNLEGIETQKDLCMLWYATEKKDTPVCGQIRREDYRMICEDMMFESQAYDARNITLCAKIRDTQRRAGCESQMKQFNTG